MRESLPQASVFELCLHELCELTDYIYIQYHLQKILQETQKLACKMQNIL